ncbi:unnamed protein product [Boreogadus saida]
MSSDAFACSKEAGLKLLTLRVLAFLTCSEPEGNDYRADTKGPPPASGPRVQTRFPSPPHRAGLLKERSPHVNPPCPPAMISPPAATCCPSVKHPPSYPSPPPTSGGAALTSAYCNGVMSPWEARR